MDKNIIVSIICTTYNHEGYIEKCLRSLVSQKTVFNFEIIVHDDCSTDGTTEIIERFHQQYPNLIVPIYQEVNQRSQGVRIISTFVLPKCQGEYIAMCEGDDYWIDENKLQKQVNLLQQNPNVDICAHAAYVYQNGEKTNVIRPKTETCIIPTREVILGDGGFVATNSLVYRKRIWDYDFQFPEILSLDYVIQILGSVNAGMLYIDEYMSVYNYMTAGSWTERSRLNTSINWKTREKVIQMLTMLDRETNHLYAKEIQKKIHEYSFLVALLKKDYKTLLGREYRSELKGLTRKDQLKCMIGAYFPFVLQCLNGEKKDENG